MRPGALRPYEQSLRERSPVQLISDDGQLLTLDVERWLDDLDEADEGVLARCRGPVLDVGCGPGRFVRAAAGLGIAALGIDVAATAVQLTRTAGGSAVLRDVFHPGPADGLWSTLLLMDGNVGIGGDVVRLLRRARSLLEPGGRLLVEAAADEHLDRALPRRFTRHGQPVGPRFVWAEVGIRPLIRHASELGFTVEEIWTVSARTFVAFTRSSADLSDDECTPSVA